MAIYLELVNFDEKIKQLHKPPIILNELKFYSEKERQDLIKQFLTEYSSDKISTLPQCECGALIGEYAIGQICDICNTVVENNSATEIEPIFWLKSPVGVAKLINPTILNMLREEFKSKDFNIIDYLIYTKYEEPKKGNKIFDYIKTFNIARGYNNFVENFYEILNILINLPNFGKHKKDGDNFLFNLIRDNGDKIFSDYIPIPHKDLLVIEKVKNSSYMDKTSQIAISAFNLMAGIDKKMADKSIITRMDRTVKALIMISSYYVEFYKLYLAPKEGILRHHIFSTRTHFSFRAVITSLTQSHRYDEIHIPWGVAIGTLRVHIMNKLLKMKYDHNDAMGFINMCVNERHPLMEKILDELIEESPNKAIPCLFNRNPTLLMGSVQLLYITKIKKDLTDNTIGLPILLTGLYNADFDGDEMNGALSVDNKLYELWYPLSTHRNIHEMTSPFKLTGHLMLSKPLISMISTWLNTGD